MNFQQKVASNIQTREMLVRGDRVLVAVSGGPDSVALLHVLNSLHDELGLYLEVAHVEHGMRGEEAVKDARFVAELTEKLKLPFHLKELDVPRMRAEAGKGNAEALAREGRYRFFVEVAREQKLGKIITAHTRDDQAETVLMWLLRGAGRKGLGGMAPMQTLNTSNGTFPCGVKVVRPLLAFSKDEVLEYLKENKIRYRRDRTNLDTRLLRNWIRVKLMPLLEKRFGSNLSARLANQARMLRQEDDLLDRFARSELDRMRRGNEIDRASFIQQPRAMQRRVLRVWIGGIRGDLHALDFEHVESAIQLIAGGTPQVRLALPGGWDLVREYENIRLVRRSGQSAKNRYHYPLCIDRPLYIVEAEMRIDCKKIEAPLEHLPTSQMEAVFDLAKLSKSLSVRNFRTGDRLQPLGMRGRKKVKDLFIEKKLPLSARATCPLLTMGREILWIVGVGRSNLAMVDRHTTSILRLKAVHFGR